MRGGNTAPTKTRKEKKGMMEFNNLSIDWIDVETRLPECEGYYLCSVCCADSNGGVPMVEVLFFNGDPATWEVFAQGDGVIAWTYLPKPYKYEEYI